MIDVIAEESRISYEIRALEEYDRSLFYSIRKCELMPDDEFYSSVVGTLRKKQEQVQEWHENLKEQEAAVKRLVTWQNRAEVLDMLADNSALPPSGVEVAEEQLRSLKEKAYTAQALVDLRM